MTFVQNVWTYFVSLKITFKIWDSKFFLIPQFFLINFKNHYLFKISLKDFLHFKLNLSFSILKKIKETWSVFKWHLNLLSED